MDYTKMKGCHPGGDPVGLKGPDGMNTLSSYQAGREDTIALIRAEIERRKKERPFSDDFSLTAYYHGLSRIYDFLDTLQEPGVTNYLLEYEPTRAVRLPDGRFVTEKLARQIGINLLNKAADELALRAFPEKKSYSCVYDRVVDYNAVDRKNYRDGILAGAEWMKKLIMKEAVEGLFQNTPFPTICLDDCKNYDFKDDDKVRIIIVKEDQK